MKPTTIQPPNRLQPTAILLLAVAVCVAAWTPMSASAQPKKPALLPPEGNLKIRVGDDSRAPVVFLIDKGLIYEGDRKSEDAILYNFRSDLVRPGRERTGDPLLRLRENRVVDPDNNTVFTVSNGKIFGPDDRQTVLYTVGGSKVYAGDDRRGEPLYTWSGSNWNNQQAALLIAVLLELELLPVEDAAQPQSAGPAVFESASDRPAAG